jgi:hypothetical protein
MSICKVEIQGKQLLAFEGERITIDEQVAKVGREQFTQNYYRNCLYSKCSNLAGISSFIGFGLSIYKFFTSPITAIGLAGISFILNRLWIKNRDQEGYALLNALKTESEDESIRQLSLGANIYADLSEIYLKDSGTVLQRFAKRGKTKVVAYLASLESDLIKRTKIVTEALPYAANKETAQLLIDLGADITINKHDDLMYFCCLRKNLELVKFFVDAGVKFDAGITDYEKWQTDLDERGQKFGVNWCSDNNAGVSPNLHPYFCTPLERLMGPYYYPKPNEKDDSPFINNAVEAFGAMGVDPSVYQNKNSATELYHALNRAGVRIRLQYAEILFTQLPGLSKI